MLLERKQDLAVYYFIEDLFTTLSSVTVVDGFPEELLTIPTVAVDNDNIESFSFELGNRGRRLIRVWTIDVFASNKSQRDDFAYTVLHALEECIPVYDYDQGFPPTVVPQIGCLNVETLRLEVVKVMPQVVDKLHYRASVTFTATFENS